MRELQKILGRVLLLTGALAFACWGYLVLHQIWFQRVANRVLQQQIAKASASSEDAAQLLTSSMPLRDGEMIGRLEIPRLNVSVIVLEGSDSSVLDVAAGHIPGTPLPGVVSGNVGIAAHRDTFFHSLQGIRPHDRLSIKTLGGVFEYGVEGTEVVEPGNIEVLRQTSDAELTLVTCYPFNYVGSAPKRFIVHARQRN